ncbi:MAG TPA: DNA-3-methyladenine glycosylase [Candidatus Saccharimonadales bacterium]|nr:DNA-3-methyladenine glycosylase [Candidatus Saccharimonadales bacterium]
MSKASGLQAAADHLSQHDPVLAPIIERAGLAKLQPHHNYYQALCDSIISQQLSVKAAATIERRFKVLFGLEDFPPPEAILSKSIEELRTAGLSQAKANYIRDLAEHVVSGRLRFDHLDSLTNDEVVAELTDVKGIGEWTAHMFLMFCMGRLDILPVGDLGIRNGVRNLYGLTDAATPDQIHEIAAKNSWHPYESVASWYIWHSLDNKPAI